MKSAICASLIVLSFSSFGQLKQIEAPTRIDIGKNGRFISAYSLDDDYIIEYRDMKYTQFVELKSFVIGSSENFDSLHDIMKSGLDAVPEKEVIFELNDDIVRLEFAQVMGIINIRFVHQVYKSDVIGISAWITKKKLDKLFGKY